MKKILILTLSLLIGLSSVAYAAINGKYQGKDIVKVTFNGKAVQTDAVPGYLDNGSTMVPLGLLRKMGLQVDWNNATLTANVKSGTPEKAQESVTLDQVSDLMDSVFKVTGYKTGEHTQGSGFVIDNVLITNFHVAGTADRIEIEINGEKINKTPADVVFSNEKVDIMGIRLDGQKSLKYTSTLPKIGDKVYTMGFPNDKFRMTEGVVLTVLEKDGVNTIVHSALTDHGSSGGILFNSSGEVVGTTSWLSGNLKSGGVVPTSYILDELNKLR